jgi:predicted permease
MRRLRAWFSRLGAEFGRRGRERELSAEMESHLQLHIEDNLRCGMTPQEARRQALLKLGGLEQTKDNYRERRSLPILETMWQDFRYGFRMLWKNPGFTATAILTLGLGIGANTAIFSVVNTVLLQQLPLPEPDRVMVIYRYEGSSIPYPEFLDLQAQHQSFELLALHRRDSVNLAGAGEPERVVVRMVSPDFFPIVGLQPLLGRTFGKEDDHLGAAPVVLLSEGLWRRKFSADAKLVGTSIIVDGQVCAVVGIVPVLPKLFAQTDVYYPIGQWSEPSFRERGGGFGSVGLARLKSGVALPQARVDMSRIAGNLAAAYPKQDAELKFSALPFRDANLGKLRGALLLLFGAVGFVLLIACANVANLLLARSSSRQRELAARIALGATRARIVGQLLTETLLLSILGGGLGLSLAVWGTRAMIVAAPAGLLPGEGAAIDLRVLFFTLLLSVLTGTIFGLIPALKASRVDVQTTLKEGGRGSSGAHHRAQGILVVSEIGLAMVLLVGAGLLIRSLERVWAVSPGFDPHNVVTFSIALSADKARSAAKTREMYIQLIDGLKSLPGADSASVVFGNLPFTGDSDINVYREDRPKPDKVTDMPDALWYSVGPDYLRAMRIALLRGRSFTPQDAEGAPLVAVINDTMARKLFPNEDPLGKTLHLQFFEESVQIIGVVGTLKHFGLDAPPDADNQLQLYLSFRQTPDRLVPLLAKDSFVVVRTSAPQSNLFDAVRQQVRAVDDQQVLYGLGTMDQLLDGSLAFRRFSMLLLGVFAALALLLASVGIYGVIPNLVGQRTHEIGVRMALGAQRGDVLRLVLGHGVSLDLLGVVLGIAAALPLMRLLGSQLFGVTPADPLTFCGVALLLTAVALLACYIPARRAMRVDPMVALRYE